MPFLRAHERMNKALAELGGRWRALRTDAVRKRRVGGVVTSDPGREGTVRGSPRRPPRTHDRGRQPRPAAHPRPPGARHPDAAEGLAGARAHARGRSLGHQERSALSGPGSQTGDRGRPCGARSPGWRRASGAGRQGHTSSRTPTGLSATATESSVTAISRLQTTTRRHTITARTIQPPPTRAAARHETATWRHDVARQRNEAAALRAELRDEPDLTRRRPPP